MYIPLTFEGSQAKCLFASGGYEGYFISGSQQYKYHWFTGSANLEVQKGTINNVTIIVVGGGGGGACGDAAGGGGGGGVNFDLNARLFQGTYNVSVGKGGKGGQNTGSGNPGDNGVASSFIGSNLSMIAGGGFGGNYTNVGFGGASGTPTSFAGGSNTSNRGGGGGGASAAGTNATTSPAASGNGGAGLTFSIANYTDSFGCGGGGNSQAIGPAGAAGCESAGQGGGTSYYAREGSNRYGGGGGGQFINFTSIVGQDGGSGSVVIQYPIYDYCTNYFNETGSCGCREITFDATDTLNFYPNLTGSYIYMPCGGNKFVSGSLIAYSPLTVCAVSNSYYSVAGYQGGSGFVNSGAECVSASLVPIACSPEAFVATCSSSIVTIYTPSASVGTPNTFGYVLPGTTQHSMYDSTSARVKYICISTGSLYQGNQIYPQVLTGGNASMINSASCSTVTFTSTVAPGFNRQGKYYDCNGNYQTFSGNGPFSITACIDTNTFFGFVGPGTTGSTSITIGGDCLTGSNVPYCGCQTVYDIQNCASASVTASIALSGSLSLSVGNTFTAIGTGLTGSCWSVLNSYIPTSGGFTLTYNNVITSSTFINCDTCEQKYTISECDTTQSFVVKFSGSIPSNGTVFKSNTSGLVGKCLTMGTLASAAAVLNYNNVTTSSTFINCDWCTLKSGSIDYLIVAGGGGGGNVDGAGGGAGGLLSGSLLVDASTIYPIVVGLGGGTGSNGQTSSFNNIIALGGGFGGYGSTTFKTGSVGGSGGGGSSFGYDLSTSGSLGTIGQGNAGGAGRLTGGSNKSAGGGGGSSQNGQSILSSSAANNGGFGGSGSKWVDGTFYAGGGGGSFEGSTVPGRGGAGGIGGGGSGSQYLVSNGVNGTANTGGGGGGGTLTSTAGAGGSGVVKLRYESGSIMNATGGTILVSGSYVYHTFTGSGVFDF